MKHPKLLIILCSVLAVVMVVLFVTSLFSIKDLTVQYSVYGKAEFDDVENILAEYRNTNIFFFDEKKLEDKINSRTAFNVESIEKVYPSTIKIVLSSRQERFAVPTGDGRFFILDELFTVCDIQDSTANNTDTLGNILLTFKNIDVGELEMKTRLDTTEAIPFGVIETLAAEAGSPRDFITSIDLEDMGYKNYYLTAFMREGVVIEIRKVDIRTEEKVKAALGKYFALSDKDKLSGRIICYELASGEIVADYE